jgi:hypothetical protein
MRQHGDDGKPDGKLISASEIACYAYCSEQWRLEYGLGLASDNQAWPVRSIGTGNRLKPSERRGDRWGRA